MSEVEEIMKRVSSHKGVTGAIIIDKEGTEAICYLVCDQYMIYLRSEKPPFCGFIQNLEIIVPFRYSNSFYS